MAAKHPKRPRDINEWARHMVDLATGNAIEPNPSEGTDEAAVSLGRRGSLKGGKARAAKMTPKRRAEIARKAVKARWDKRGPHSAGGPNLAFRFA